MPRDADPSGLTLVAQPRARETADRRPHFGKDAEMLPRNRLAVTLAAFLFVLQPCSRAEADSWALPETRKIRSANGRYTALLIPGKVGHRDAQGPRVHVYEGEPGADGQWRTVWAVDLSNRVSPCSVYLTDDA